VQPKVLVLMLHGQSVQCLLPMLLLLLLLDVVCTALECFLQCKQPHSTDRQTYRQFARHLDIFSHFPFFYLFALLWLIFSFFCWRVYKLVEFQQGQSMKALLTFCLRFGRMLRPDATSPKWMIAAPISTRNILKTLLRSQLNLIRLNVECANSFSCYIPDFWIGVTHHNHPFSSNKQS